MRRLAVVAVMIGTLLLGTPHAGAVTGNLTDDHVPDYVGLLVTYDEDTGKNYDPVTGVDPVSGYPETGGSRPPSCTPSPATTTSPRSPTPAT